MEDCYNLGTVKVERTQAGGLVGRYSTSTYYALQVGIHNCYHAGSVQYGAEEAEPVAGHLVGLVQGADGTLTTQDGDPQMILEDVSGRVVRTVSYNVEFDGDSREMCLYYTTKTGEPYSQDRRVFPKVLADGTYVYTLPRTQVVALRLDPCSPDENKTVGLTFTPQSITLNAASTLPGGADYFIPTWYQLFGLIVYPALAAAALDWLWAVGRQLAKKKQ